MIKFTYTKKNKDVSNRVGLLVSSPSAVYGVLDISDIDPADQVTVNGLYTKYLAEREEVLKTLSDKYGLTNLFKSSYKNFLPEGMENIEVI